MGIDCDKQHVKECPDFAENGICPNRACKLPHVIRANRRRQTTTSTSHAKAQTLPQTEVEPTIAKAQTSAKEEYISVVSTGTESSGAAEEYISLTFEESDDDDDEDDDDNDEDDGDTSGDDQDAEVHEKGRIE